MSLHKEELIEELFCKICDELMVPPIYMCGVGHSICNQCYEKVTRCPTCNNAMQSKGVRNYSLETIFNRTKQPCKNADFGCKVTILGEQIKDHMKTCVVYQCPLKQNVDKVCVWRGVLQELKSHAEEDHRSSIVSVNKEMKFSHFKVNHTGFFCIFQHESVFKFGEKILEGGLIKMCLQKIGAVEEANRYLFCVKFKNEDGQQFLAMSTCQSYSDDNEKCFDSQSDYITLNMLQLNNNR